MHIIDQLFPGVYLLETSKFHDCRGHLAKTFSQSSFKEIGVDFVCKEIFHSLSVKDVIRGMHYQDLSYPQDKIIHCSVGSILDVVVDIRPNSPHFNKPKSVHLQSTDSKILYIKSGFAHGFLSLSDNSLVNYSVSTNYDPLLDMGVAWNSIRYDWPINNPILSSRDCQHPSIDSL